MPQVAVCHRINAPSHRVWEGITDFEHAPQRVSTIVRVEMLTAGPVGKGTRFKETRIMFKKEATETMEVLAWNPPRSFTLGAESCGCRYRSEITLHPVGDATDVTLTFEATPLTFMGRVMSFLMGWMMKGVCAKAFTKDLVDLERSLTGGSPGPAAQSARA